MARPPADRDPPVPALPSVAGPAPRSRPTPAALAQALRRRWPLAGVLGGLAAVAVAAAVWALLPAGGHAARAVVQLRPAGPDVVGGSPGEADAARRSQAFALRSRDLLNATVADPAVKGLGTIARSADPARQLEDNLTVEAGPAPDLLTVTLAGGDPADLVVVLDALVRRYVGEANTADRLARDDRRRDLDRLADGFRAEVQARERQIRLAAEANGVLGGEAAEAKHARMQGELAKIEADVYAARQAVGDAEVRADQAERAPPDPDPAEVAARVAAHPRVAPLVARKENRAAALARARQVATDDTAPTVVDLKAQLARAEADLADARAAVRGEVVSDLRAAAERARVTRQAEARDRLDTARTALASRVKWRDEYGKMLSNSAKGAYDIQALLDEVKPHKDHLNRAVGRRVQLDAGDARPRVAVREGAVPLPDRASWRRPLLAAAAGGLALLVVLVTVAYLEWRTRRVGGVDQVVADLGLRVIGTVPAFPSRAKLAAAGGAGDADWRFALNEAVGSTRTMLLHAARNQGMQVVMVTSATQGEGKTSLTGQLAASMAGSGLRTLVVDCDLRNPSVHTLFELGEAAGVGEVLCQEADAADAVQPTAVPNLWAIPAGRCSARVVAAIAQGRPLEALFNRLRGQFDFILVDSCPVLPVADALLVGQHVDGVVFAVMQDLSQVPQVRVATDRLAQLNVPLLGAVVNGVRPGPGYHAYGYNYVKQLPA